MGGGKGENWGEGIPYIVIVIKRLFVEDIVRPNDESLYLVTCYCDSVLSVVC